MINVASLELCRDLYELSKWHDQQWWHNYDGRSSKPDGTTDYKWFVEPRMLRFESQPLYTSVPAYDLGYLLRRLPPFIWSEQYEQKAWLWLRKNTADYNAWYWVNDPKYGEDQISEHGATSDTPEDAACNLAIELFKQGVLK